MRFYVILQEFLGLHSNPPVLQFGSTKAFSMIKASLGEYDDFIEQWAEDVVVLAHTHKAYSGTFKGKNGKVIYVNSGCWLGTNKQVKLQTFKYKWY